MNKFFFAVAVLIFASSANAANYYSSEQSCKASYHENKVAAYQPTGKHKKYSDARIAGYEKRALEGDACIYLGAMPGKRWVYLKQGTVVYTKGVEVKYLAECQNDIYQVVYLSKEKEVLMEAPSAKVEAKHDLWKFRIDVSSASNPLPCAVEKLTGEPKPSFCSTLEVVTPLKGETRPQWRQRVAQKFELCDARAYRPGDVHTCKSA